MMQPTAPAVCAHKVFCAKPQPPPRRTSTTAPSHPCCTGFERYKLSLNHTSGTNSVLLKFMFHCAFATSSSISTSPTLSQRSSMLSEIPKFRRGIKRQNGLLSIHSTPRGLHMSTWLELRSTSPQRSTQARWRNSRGSLWSLWRGGMCESKYAASLSASKLKRRPSAGAPGRSVAGCKKGPNVSAKSNLGPPPRLTDEVADRAVGRPRVGIGLRKPLTIASQPSPKHPRTSKCAIPIRRTRPRSLLLGSRISRLVGCAQ
mmetsp:Transcript_59171/g.157486  ORF Transcript_59171/g.157486 Transcript_59171/m.157486 type:complete len:259 (-) Transcript_59171:356-1132(-)